MERSYIAIDLKSFFASVECVERGLNPLTTNLVVADESRTDKTICLAVTPALKARGVPGRPRLFEVKQKVRDINNQRGRPLGGLRGKSVYDEELNAHPEYAVDFIIAPPRMSYYIDYSTRIYGIYLNYVSAEDMHVYSIDEVFIDATNYLKTYKMTAHELAMKMIQDVLKQTGITATAGIGTNLFLCKIAMDIVAKHIPADKDGVRIAELDEMSYRKTLWNHTPLTDFWRLGGGTARRLASIGITTMGEIARCSVHHEEILYKMFGINAELLIDHAWGWEPCTIDKIKAYRPETNSLSSGQVLHCPYDYKKTRVVVLEMADAAAMTLLEKGLVTNQLVLSIGYDTESLTKPEIAEQYHGEVYYDYYGRKVPKPAQGTVNLMEFSSSSKTISQAVEKLFEQIIDRSLLVRRINLASNHVVPEFYLKNRRKEAVQLELFVDYDKLREEEKLRNQENEKERRMQQTILDIKHKYGKNSILKGLSFMDGATAKDRNQQIGGHKA